MTPLNRDLLRFQGCGRPLRHSDLDRLKRDLLGT
jgi:hypothetical protein